MDCVVPDVMERSWSSTTSSIFTAATAALLSVDGREFSSRDSNAALTAVVTALVRELVSAWMSRLWLTAAAGRTSVVSEGRARLAGRPRARTEVCEERLREDIALQQV